MEMNMIWETLIKKEIIARLHQQQPQQLRYKREALMTSVKYFKQKQSSIGMLGLRFQVLHSGLSHRSLVYQSVKFGDIVIS